MKPKYLSYLLGLLLASCEAVDFDDPSTLTNEEATAKIKTFSYSLIKSSVQTTFTTTTSSGGVHFSLLADQSTNTNGSSNWWNYAIEPRIRILNSSTERSYTASLNLLYSNFYQANLDATKVLELIEQQGNHAYDDQDADRTEDCRIGAYYAKGVSQGYLGVIYDRGIIVDATDITERAYPNSYKEMVENGIRLIDRSIALAEGNTNFKFDFLLGITIDKETFIQLANSMAARILASVARDKNEAAALGNDHWQRVLDYARKGFKSDYLLPTVSGGYYNGLVDRLTYTYMEHAYVPVDVKIPYLADKTGSYPDAYPTDDTVLDPIESDDPRFDEYFGYDPQFGILMEARGRNLFSNYYRKRWANSSNTLDVPGAINPYFLAEELRLLQTESYLWMKNYEEAARLLNAPEAIRKSKGHLPDVQADEAEIRKALHYEYAIEIDGAGGVFNPFAFMRRNDLLIGGTPTEYPIPQTPLEVVGIEVYSFGGKEYAGETGIWGELGTARDNGWKPIG